MRIFLSRPCCHCHASGTCRAFALLFVDRRDIYFRCCVAVAAVAVDRFVHSVGFAPEKLGCYAEKTSELAVASIALLKMHRFLAQINVGGSYRIY